MWKESLTRLVNPVNSLLSFQLSFDMPGVIKILFESDRESVIICILTFTF